eukprot:1143371-Pelagomonas_calceolata.AAC.1
MSTSLQYPLFGKPASALHILSGYKRSTMPKMVTNRHKIASTALAESSIKLSAKAFLAMGQALPPWTLAAQIVLLYRTCSFLNTQQI